MFDTSYTPSVPQKQEVIIPPELEKAMKEAAFAYRRRHPKASQREVRRAIAKKFNIKLI